MLPIIILILMSKHWPAILQTLSAMSWWPARSNAPIRFLYVAFDPLYCFHFSNAARLWYKQTIQHNNMRAWQMWITAHAWSVNSLWYFVLMLLTSARLSQSWSATSPSHSYIDSAIWPRCFDAPLEPVPNTWSRTWVWSDTAYMKKYNIITSIIMIYNSLTIASIVIEPDLV